MANRFFSYYNKAVELVAAYNGAIPLQHFLKQYFALNRKHGSKDRKWIAHFCYCYFRLGKALPDLPIENRMLIGVYLCTSDLSDLTEILPQEWSLTATDKVAGIQSLFPRFRIEDIFPFEKLVEPALDLPTFARSILQQPRLFLRIRPGYAAQVWDKLAKAGIPFEKITESCLSLPNGTSVDTILDINREVVIQDYASQQIAHLFPQMTDIQTIWDCCAASGGKSILAKDIFPQATLTVSDIRSSIIANLHTRFKQANIAPYRAFLADLTKPVASAQQYDFVICDAPCSGSGTWARTPENIAFFDEENMAKITDLQKKIAANASQKVKMGGWFLYITCSVFEAENQHIVKELMASGQWEISDARLFAGYHIQGDCLFGALLRKIK